MPNELFLVRHAEAENSNIQIKDVDRPLTPDGEIIASKAGKFLGNLIQSPDLMLSSNSVRTTQTSYLLAEQIQYNASQISFTEELYEASTRILMRVINGIEDNYKKVVLIGHNPSISFLSEYITGAEIGNVNPAGIVHIKFDVPWNEISEKNADLVQYYDSSLFIK